MRGAHGAAALRHRPVRLLLGVHVGLHGHRLPAAHGVDGDLLVVRAVWGHGSVTTRPAASPGPGHCLGRTPTPVHMPCAHGLDASCHTTVSRVVCPPARGAPPGTTPPSRLGRRGLASECGGECRACTGPPPGPPAAPSCCGKAKGRGSEAWPDLTLGTGPSLFSSATLHVATSVRRPCVEVLHDAWRRGWDVAPAPGSVSDSLGSAPPRPVRGPSDSLAHGAPPGPPLTVELQVGLQVEALRRETVSRCGPALSSQWRRA